MRTVFYSFIIILQTEHAGQYYLKIIFQDNLILSVPMLTH